MPIFQHQKAFPVLLAVLLACQLSAQNRQDLSKKRQQLIAEIDRASKLLASTKKDKKQVLNQYYTVQRQIKQRQELIETLEKEIDLSNKSIKRTTGAIRDLQFDMERLESEYGEMARQAYRNKMNDNQLLFLFSAEGLSDGIKRWRYIQRYDEYRKKQAALILDTREVLTSKLNGIEIKKAEQQDLLLSAERQQELLAKELTTKNKLLKGIKADESRISRLINRKRVAHQKLSTAIENIIAKEIRERERVNTAPTKKDVNKSDRKIAKKSTTESKKITNATKSFRQLKGRLAWPVINGLITRHFGKQNHPIHKNIQITNNGIDIRATTNNKVKAIADGLVAGSQYVPGYKNTLIVQHGNYYSVYSNLEHVGVRKGETIATGQVIGLAGQDSQDQYLEVHLEIWKGKQRLNPAVWLRR
ncbi:MAG: peptidoglycan DD-metalloendopeptidase family protein [Bacteroidota bacterium]